MKLFLYNVIFLICITSCVSKKKKSIDKYPETTNSSIKYAKGFDIQQYKGYKKLVIKMPYPNAKNVLEYKIIRKKIVKLLPNSTSTIYTPVTKIIVTSTTHIPMLELLKEQTALVGFPNTNYISSKKTQKLINTGVIKEIGQEDFLNTEIVLNLHPDVIVGFSIKKNNSAYSILKQAGIPIILNGDWLEQTPLGRAEWIKVFGLLFNKEKMADSIFNTIEMNYLRVKNAVKKMKSKPMVLSGAIMNNDIWNLPAGESFTAQFFKDANVNYLWKDTKGRGSLSLSFESVLEIGKNADFWIKPGCFSSKEQLLSANEHYKEFRSFKKGTIFTPNNKRGVTGGIIYFEKSAIRPDLVLKDIIKITNPKILPNYTLTFFEKIK